MALAERVPARGERAPGPLSNVLRPKNQAIRATRERGLGAGWRGGAASPTWHCATQASRLRRLSTGVLLTPEVTFPV